MKKKDVLGKMPFSGRAFSRFVLSAVSGKLCFALAVLCLPAICLFAAPSAFADPPQEIGLTYDLSAQTLTVNITHKSFATGMHYIKQIDIKRNSEPISTNSYKSQPGKTSFAYAFKIPAAANDKLEVTTTCNLRGSKAASLMVDQPQKP